VRLSADDRTCVGRICYYAGSPPVATDRNDWFFSKCDRSNRNPSRASFLASSEGSANSSTREELPNSVQSLTPNNLQSDNWDADNPGFLFKMKSVIYRRSIDLGT
jgi:hypothetical protein